MRSMRWAGPTAWVELPARNGGRRRGVQLREVCMLGATCCPRGVRGVQSPRLGAADCGASAPGATGKSKYKKERELGG